MIKLKYLPLLFILGIVLNLYGVIVKNYSLVACMLGIAIVVGCACLLAVCFFAFSDFKAYKRTERDKAEYKRLLHR